MFLFMLVLDWSQLFDSHIVAISYFGCPSKQVEVILSSFTQLQLELNAADSSLLDSYKRLEKMKSAIDALKQNEESLKSCISDYQEKLKSSEDRYQRLRKQAESKMEQ